jgi:cytochrome c oxidase subunit 2
VAVPTIQTIFYNANSPEPGALTVNVVARQWWWEFRYPHPTEADQEVITANELHIPVNEVVNIVLDSKDVLHSFWIPKIAGKVDVVPNNTNIMWIEADDPGEYLGQCAEFCGVAHANMRFRVIAESREEFDAWLLRQAAPAFDSTDPLVIEGRALFEGQAQCFACHTVAGVKKARGTRGPNLTHLASRGHIAAGLYENTRANLMMWLIDPEAAKPGNIMSRDASVYNDPNMELTEAQLEALVAFLRSLR